jgi:nucleotide-binding universal stress UspA family protein
MSELHVLVPLDGSQAAESILPIVRALAPARATLIFVAANAGDPNPLDLDIFRQVHRTAAELRLRGVPRTDAVIQEGVPADCIVRLASQLKVDLIAMSTSGRSGLDRILVGSVARAVLRAAPVPVLASRWTHAALPADAPAPPLFGRVLVAYDGSDPAGRALDALVATAVPRSTPILLFGAVEPLRAVAVPLGPSGEGFDASYVDLVEDGVRAELERGAARTRALGFADVATEVDVGSRADRILAAAARHRATLLAMGTHGRSGPTRWVLGSVAESVLRAAPVPLLVTR